MMRTLLTVAGLVVAALAAVVVIGVLAVLVLFATHHQTELPPRHEAICMCPDCMPG